VLFGLEESRVTHSLNDYLWGNCEISATAHDVTPAGTAGRVFLIPSSINPGEIARVLREGYDVGVLNDGLQGLTRALDLDLLLLSAEYVKDVLS